MWFLSKLIPIRDWLYLALAVALLIAFAWYRHSLIMQGVNSQKEAVMRANAQWQSIMDQNSEIYQAQSQKTQIEYRTRTKEIIKNVPVNHSCDLPVATVGMLNNAIKGNHSASKSLSRMYAASPAK